MRKKLLMALPLVGVVMFGGCATIAGGGGKQTISINSDSSKQMKAVVSYEDGSSPQFLTIPGTVTVERANQNILIKSKDGEFQPATVEKNVNDWFWGNILVGGLLGSTTDATTGSMWKYDDATTVHEK